MQDTNPDSKMPPSYAAVPNVDAADLAVIKKWIDLGAPNELPLAEALEVTRKYTSTQDKLLSIHQYLKRLPKEDRPYQRFFTLEHLHNLPSKEITAAELRSVRAATSKVLNSLSWKPDMVLPKAIDGGNQTILVFDLRDMDWDAAHSTTGIDFWQYLIDGYPYGVTYESFADDDQMRELASEVYLMAGTNLPMIRADWFIGQCFAAPILSRVIVRPSVTERDAPRSSQRGRS